MAKDAVVIFGVDGLGVRANVDQISRSLEVIQHSHQEIHEGNTYEVDKNATMGSGVQMRFLIQVADGVFPHFLFASRASAEANSCLYEGGSYSNVGVAEVAQNHNRNVGNSSFTTITSTPTIVVTGTCINQRHYGAGPTRGGEDRGVNEWDLSPDQVYLWILHSEAATNDVTGSLIWYEKTIAVST